MDIDGQIKLLEEQLEVIRDLRNLNHRDSRFISWRKMTLSHLENIFSEGSEYVRRFETLTFQEPGLGATMGSRTSYGDMGSFVHDLERSKTILEDGIEALRRLRPPKTKAKTTTEETLSGKPLSKEPPSDEAFFERTILEKTLSEGPVAEKLPEEDLRIRKGALKNSYEESGSTVKIQSVEDVGRYVSSLLYHYISLEENPRTKKLLQAFRAELDNPARSKESLIHALKALWGEGKDILVDIMARVLSKKQ